MQDKQALGLDSGHKLTTNTSSLPGQSASVPARVLREFAPASTHTRAPAGTGSRPVEGSSVST